MTKQPSHTYGHPGLRQKGAPCSQRSYLSSSTVQALIEWQSYKHSTALAFVDRGYSVTWLPDGSHWMEVFLPARQHSAAKRVSAEVEFFEHPFRYGINRGRISALTITLPEFMSGLGPPHVRAPPYTLYHYEKRLLLNRLATHTPAEQLYSALLEVLN